MRKLSALLITTLLSLSLPLQAAEQRKICVFDLIGNVGPVMGAMRDWQVAALEWGVEVELIPFTNEAIAAEDLKAGKCDAALITGIRARLFNTYAGTLDSVGGVPSMDHLRILLQVLSTPSSASAALNNGTYEIMGIAPAGGAYIFVNDRKINSLAKAAGKKVAVLDYDKTQAKLVAQVGATPVASDITNFSTKFNLDRILEALNKEAAAVDKKWWVEIPEEDKQEYQLMMQQARLQMRDEGFYSAEMLTLERKVRCKLDGSNPECVNPVE